MRCGTLLTVCILCVMVAGCGRQYSEASRVHLSALDVTPPKEALVFSGDTDSSVAYDSVKSDLDVALLLPEEDIVVA